GVPKSRRLYTLLDHFIDRPSPLEKYIKSLIPLHLRIAWASNIIGMSTRRVQIDSQLQAQLATYFAEDVEKLEDLLHRDLRCWNTEVQQQSRHRSRNSTRKKAVSIYAD